jgi:hypothetical protein
VIRIRPLSGSEISLQGRKRCVRQDSSQSLTWTGHPESRFTFDLVADEHVTQVLLLLSIPSYSHPFASSDLLICAQCLTAPHLVLFRRICSRLLECPWWRTALLATTAACLLTGRLATGFTCCCRFSISLAVTDCASFSVNLSTLGICFF